VVREQATAFAPGRVNLIGEHTDYNRGLALPFAITEGVTVRAQAIAGTQFAAHAQDLDEHDRFALTDPPRGDGWRAFVHGVVAELRRAGLSPPAARMQISGSVPRGAGLSSSAALEVALALALIALTDAGEPDRLELARLCSRVENEWVGAQTGLLDQLASLFGRRDTALLIDFRSLEISPIALELGAWRLVILDSGETHAHGASGYNERREQCAQACALLGIDSLREATLDMLDRLPSPLAERARHVITENARVLDTVVALQAGDLAQVGRLLDQSHASLRDLYEVGTAAVEATAQRLRDAGAAGVRMVGGGFGGSVLGLLGPGCPTPEDALEVRAGEGARLL
jgi:galactokinase